MAEELIKKYNIKKVENCIYSIPKTADMKVGALLFLSESLLKNVEDGAMKQARNVATMPGIQKAAVAMPDMHEGYGFPIGGVAAMDIEKGCISPGGIGYDINCGVRMLATPLTKDDVMPKARQIVEAMFEHVPCGVGSKSDIRLSQEELNKVLNKGARWAVDNNYGFEDDLEHCESNGSLPDANADYVSSRAKERGKNQLDTLGAGNHFLEVQYVDKIFDKEVAKGFGIEKEGQITVMIHCGSRGLGHQVCSDFIREMEKTNPELLQQLPDRQLVYAPLGSDLAKRYFGAMCAAANYAWCNRHIIAHRVRTAFKQVFGTKPEELKTIYDVAHNIAKIEEHVIDGKKKKVMMHRKGATRAFPAEHPEIPKAYRKIGQPAILPGTMGTASYILVGTQKGLEMAFGSTAHGAGRAMSRHGALRQFRGETIKKELEAHNIIVKSASWKGIAEEAPKAYKNVDEVIKATEGSGICKIVARVRPIGVVKG
ncbi:RNA-splicing ligase RtcB [Candidatus Woesearchaeota archaeon]|nr:RNA-splicing ligase RtcB [Candidatus Woesearchaeota archaeon]